MEYTDREFCLEVWGDRACFTRPEFKVERVSYDVITPSSARAIFESIFWKPAFKWEITRIDVLNPIKWDSVRRNEVGALAGSNIIYIEDKRQQRNALILKDVRYRIYAKLVFIPLSKRAKKDIKDGSRSDENPVKYYEIFIRRASKGQCFNQPYFGTREFSASFKLVIEDGPATPIKEDKDLGIMLFDMDFSDKQNIRPMFYHAIMNKGVINVPSKDSEEVFK